MIIIKLVYPNKTIRVISAINEYVVSKNLLTINNDTHYELESGTKVYVLNEYGDTIDSYFIR